MSKQGKKSSARNVQSSGFWLVPLMLLPFSLLSSKAEAKVQRVDKQPSLVLNTIHNLEFNKIEEAQKHSQEGESPQEELPTDTAEQDKTADSKDLENLDNLDKALAEHPLSKLTALQTQAADKYVVKRIERSGFGENSVKIESPEDFDIDYLDVEYAEAQEEERAPNTSFDIAMIPFPDAEYPEIAPPPSFVEAEGSNPSALDYSEADYLAAQGFEAGDPGMDMVLFLELVVNGINSNHLAMVDYRNQRYFLEYEDLQETPIILKNLGGISEDAPVPINDYEGVTVSYHEALQQLHINVPPSWLPMQVLGRNDDWEESKTGFGALLNYDIYASKPRGGSGALRNWTELRVFGDYGIFSTTGVYSHNFGSKKDGADNRYRRYDTYWQYSNEEKLYTVTVGDLVTRPLTWSSASRLGGVQLSHNFRLRPDLITHPLPEFKGEVGLPSTIDLLVNGHNYHSSNLDPGPYDITDVSHLSGAGEAVLVTTDALGRTVSINVPFYVTSNLLKKGLFDYSVSTGAIRRDYGVKDFSYSGYALDASGRYGLNDNITLEFHTELASSLQVFGAGVSTNIGRIGDLNVAYTQTRHKGKSGNQVYVGYSYSHPKFNTYASYTKRDLNYRDIASMDSKRSVMSERYQLSFSAPVRDFGSFSIGFFSNKHGENQKRSNTWSLGWNRSMGEFGSLSAYVNRNNNSNNRWQASLQWSKSLGGDRGYASVSHSRSEDRSRSTSVNYGRSVPTDGGFGWNLNYRDNSRGKNYYSASTRYRNRSLEAQVGTYGSGSKDATYWSEISGALVLMDGQLLAANEVSDSFVLVSAKAPNVPVRQHSNVIGTTNRKGYYLASNVSSYYGTKFGLDPRDMPLNLYVPEIEQEVSVKQGSGYLMEFEVKEIRPMIAVLKDSSGEFIPLGSHISIEGSEEESYVGWDGEAYFENLGETNHLTVTLPEDGETCSFTITLGDELKGDPDTILQLGEFKCGRN